MKMLKRHRKGIAMFEKERMSSYVTRGQQLINEGKIPDAMKLVEKGLQYYSEKIINAISPYAAQDAGLLVLALRHLADEVEKGNPGAKELYEGLDNCVIKPPLNEKTKVIKANTY